jgi:hypothetical protein
MFGNLGQAKIPRSGGENADWHSGLRQLRQHMQTNHPDKPYMTYEEFFRERQQARYGGDGKGGVRCC